MQKTMKLCSSFENYMQSIESFVCLINTRYKEATVYSDKTFILANEINMNAKLHMNTTQYHH